MTTFQYIQQKLAKDQTLFAACTSMLQLGYMLLLCTLYLLTALPWFLVSNAMLTCGPDKQQGVGT